MLEQLQRLCGAKRTYTHIILTHAHTTYTRTPAHANTAGFPLVGGPAGSMEAGRRVDVATSILAAKNVPYVVAAPLLIQDLRRCVKRLIHSLILIFIW
jgi:magnesium chelatase subunit H